MKEISLDVNKIYSLDEIEDARKQGLLINVKEVAQLLNIKSNASVRLKKMNLQSYKGRFNSREVLYSKQDIIKWIERQSQEQSFDKNIAFAERLVSKQEQSRIGAVIQESVEKMDLENLDYMKKIIKSKEKRLKKEAIENYFPLKEKVVLLETENTELKNENGNLKDENVNLKVEVKELKYETEQAQGEVEIQKRAVKDLVRKVNGFEVKARTAYYSNNGWQKEADDNDDEWLTKI
jgi:hypothetical protein